MTLPVQRRNLAPASMVQIATFVGSRVDGPNPCDPANRCPRCQVDALTLSEVGRATGTLQGSGVAVVGLTGANIPIGLGPGEKGLNRVSRLGAAVTKSDCRFFERKPPHPP